MPGDILPPDVNCAPFAKPILPPSAANCVPKILDVNSCSGSGSVVSDSTDLIPVKQYAGGLGPLHGSGSAPSNSGFNNLNLFGSNSYKNLLSQTGNQFQKGSNSHGSGRVRLLAGPRGP